MFRFLILLLTCMTMTSSAIDIHAAKPKRNSQSVKKERRLTANEVEKTQKQINQNTAETTRQLNRLASLSAEAEQSRKQIERINAELKAMDRLIKATEDSISTLENNLKSLRNAYADNLRAIRSRRQQMSTLAMIFSSTNFTEAYRRYRYMQEFDKWQKGKSRQIAEMSAEIAARQQRAKAARSRQAAKLNELTAENARLQANKVETESLVSDLKRQGSSLKKALAEKQRKLKNLDAELDRIIAEEQRRAEEERRAEEARLAAEAKKKAEEARRAAEEKKNSKEQAQAPVQEKKTTAPPSGKPEPATKPEPRKSDKLIMMSGSFESNKGKMPFPVDGRYSIVSHFGLNSHPDVTNVKVNNSGIDIETPQGAAARAVFDGEVSSVFHVSGYQNVVMLRHGNYLTVYAGIGALAVKKGDKVKAGQTLGTIFSDPDDNNRTVLHFEVRRERAKLNPEDWVR